MAAVVCAAFVAVSSAVPAVHAEQEEFGDVQEALEVLASSPEVVGAVGEVYVDGERVGRGSAGTRLIDGKGGRIPDGSRYRAGSQTKQMTGVVIMQLVQEGKLSLDAKLSDLLPEAAGKDLVERSDEITLRQLIQHTSGIPDWFDPKLVPFFDFTTRYSPMELVRRSRSVPRSQEPGEKFSYSNTNYMLLGLIIERTTRHTVAAEFDQRIFEPLEMTRSHLRTGFPGAVEGPHGHGYYPDEKGRLHDFDRFNVSYGYAAGGVISTAHDLSTFQRAFAANRLLPKELQDELLPPGAPQNPTPLCGGDPAFGTVAGSAPGFNSTTYNSRDGRIQFAMSATLAVDNADPRIHELISKAAEAVLCPAK
ncbi:serine hydrolase domain-containing protein [Spirillospora sp. CA-108201]